MDVCVRVVRLSGPVVIGRSHCSAPLLSRWVVHWLPELVTVGAADQLGCEISWLPLTFSSNGASSFAERKHHAAQSIAFQN